MENGGQSAERLSSAEICGLKSDPPTVGPVPTSDYNHCCQQYHRYTIPMTGYRTCSNFFKLHRVQVRIVANGEARRWYQRVVPTAVTVLRPLAQEALLPHLLSNPPAGSSWRKKYITLLVLQAVLGEKAPTFSTTFGTRAPLLWLYAFIVSQEFSQGILTFTQKYNLYPCDGSCRHWRNMTLRLGVLLVR